MKGKKLITGIAMGPLPILVFLSIDDALFLSEGILYPNAGNSLIRNVDEQYWNNCSNKEQTKTEQPLKL